MRDTLLRAVLLTLVSAPVAEAQGVSSTADLERSLLPGQRVKVLTIDGSELGGRVDSVSGAALWLNNGRRRQELAVEQLQQVRRQRSEGDGVWIGAGIGAVIGLTYVQLHCRDASEHQDCVVGGTLLFAPAGAAIGALVDGRLHRYDTIFERKIPPPVRLGFIPLLSRRHSGLRVVISF